MPSLLLTLVAATIQMPFSMSGPYPQSMLLMRPEVQKELKLSSQQKKDIKTAYDQMGGQSNLGPMALADADVDAKVLPLLEAEQSARLLELWIQYEGASVLGKKPMQDKFGLDDNQRASVNAAVAAFEQQVMEGYRRMSSNPMAGKGMADGLKKARKEMHAALIAGLTPEQAKAFEEAHGKPFKFQGGAREL